ncbi:MAG: cell division protein FtsA [Elusimicrobiota bacterium]
MKDKIYCGLDVGSSKVCAVIASYNSLEGQLNIMGVGEEDCSGLKHGVVVNIESTNRAIVKAVEKAEKAAEVKVKDVYVSVNGSHIEGHRHQGAAKIAHSDREITEEDVERVITSARAVPLSSDRQIIHSIPLDFKVDNQQGVEIPVGMEGNHIEVEVMLITGASAPINNLDKCITRTGLGISGKVSSILAPSHAVVAKEEKELGCLSVDIGAQTINIAVFIDGALNYISEIDLGADYITYDLAHGLKTSLKEAKRIKEDYGCAFPEDSLDMEIEYIGVDGQSRNKATLEQINKIINPRVDDIIDFISREITKSGQQQMVPGGIILSGGGAELKGIDKAIKEKLQNFQVRLGRPRGVGGKFEMINSPKYATALGLMEYSINTEESGRMGVAPRGVWDKIKAWFDDMF